MQIWKVSGTDWAALLSAVQAYMVVWKNPVTCCVGVRFSDESQIKSVLALGRLKLELISYPGANIPEELMMRDITAVPYSC